MRYLYGPVPSRRLGRSLGIDIIPEKHCTLSCVYCQIGRTKTTVLERREYVPEDAILDDFREWLARGGDADWLTFSGSGEPTLHSGIGRLIREVKAISAIPVCVITNGTLLWDPLVRHDLADADAVMPSLDSAIDSTFRNICRPHPDLSAGRIIEGLTQFRTEFTGRIWLEILFVQGMNDTPAELEALRDAISRIRPDAVHLNTVVRPPTEKDAKPVSPEQLAEIRDYFGGNAEIIASFSPAGATRGDAGPEDIREYLKRRPASLEDIAGSLGLDTPTAERMLDHLVDTGQAVVREHLGKRYWEYHH